MSEELKPCPFCQSKAEHYSFNYRKHTVRCRYCLADCGEHDNPERAAFVWNTRPAEEALKEEVERLKADLDARKSALKIAFHDIKRAGEEIDKWKKMFYDLVDKQAKVSTQNNAPDTNVGTKESEGEDDP